MDKPIPKIVKDYRKVSSRHILSVEADMTHEQKCYTFGYAEKLRKISNELRHFMMKRIDQLFRTKKYRKLCREYKKYALAKDDVNRKEVARQMKIMQLEFGVTFDACRAESIRLRAKYGLHAHLVRSIFDTVWAGVEGIIFYGGRRLHFKKRGDLPVIKATERTKAIIIKNEEGNLRLHFGEISFGCIVNPKDRFLVEEMEAMLRYLEKPEANDLAAAEKYVKKGTVTDTFRPCFATLVPKIIRGRMRVYIHFTLEAKPKRKYDRNGKPRYSYGRGRVGVDIGPQTVAWYSNKGTGLVNLAERGRPVQEVERKIASIRRAMDRSIRATDPENFNEDGTIKRGKRIWHHSNNYRKLLWKLKELHRIAAINRRLSINELVNEIRSCGDIVVTEAKNADRLKRRAKKTEISEKTGKCKKKKRFGKSIHRRNPGYFQLQLKKKFEFTGGHYHEVPMEYRASQYDVEKDDFVKKELSDRYYPLYGNTRVQRDMYSAFLLSCADEKFTEIDRPLCRKTFNEYCTMQNKTIEEIKRKKLRIKNSGIKVS